MNDPYVYPGTNVLKNKANLTVLDELESFEGDMVQLSLVKILREKIDVSSVTSIFQIHRTLFSEVYDWAGKKRTINIYKEEPVLNGLSVSYTDYRHIDNDLKRIDKDIRMIEWKTINQQTIIGCIVHIIADLWRTHAFREGNTRTVSVFLYFFMQSIGLEIKFDFLGSNSKFFRNALVMASIDQYSEYQHLERMLAESLVSDVYRSKSNYDTINGYDLKKYEYNYHHIKDD